jgi:hypothetical protein
VEGYRGKWGDGLWREHNLERGMPLSVVRGVNFHPYNGVTDSGHSTLA